MLESRAVAGRLKIRAREPRLEAVDVRGALATTSVAERAASTATRGDSRQEDPRRGTRSGRPPGRRSWRLAAEETTRLLRRSRNRRPDGQLTEVKQRAQRETARARSRRRRTSWCGRGDDRRGQGAVRGGGGRRRQRRRRRQRQDGGGSAEGRPTRRHRSGEVTCGSSSTHRWDGPPLSVGEQHGGGPPS